MISNNVKSIIVEAYRRFGTKPFKRSDMSIKVSFGPVYNTGYLKRMGDSISVTKHGETYAKKLINTGEFDNDKL